MEKAVHHMLTMYLITTITLIQTLPLTAQPGWLTAQPTSSAQSAHAGTTPVVHGKSEWTMRTRIAVAAALAGTVGLGALGVRYLTRKKDKPKTRVTKKTMVGTVKDICGARATKNILHGLNIAFSGYGAYQVPRNKKLFPESSALTAVTYSALLSNIVFSLSSLGSDLTTVSKNSDETLRMVKPSTTNKTVTKLSDCFAGEIPEPIEDLVRFVQDEEYRKKLEDRDLCPTTCYLLHGPPGNGKTKLVEVLARVFNVTCYAPIPSDIKESFMGASARAITSYFERARKKAESSACGMTILFFDEIDSYLPSRTNQGSGGHSGQEHTDIVNTFLTQLGDPNNRCIIVIGATSKNLDQLDENAIRTGRFQHIKMDLPDLRNRHDIAALYIKKHALYNSVNGLPQLVATQSVGWSAAEIEYVITDVTRRLVTTIPDSNTTPSAMVITAAFEQALNAHNKAKQQRLTAHYQASQNLAANPITFDDLAGGEPVELRDLIYYCRNPRYREALAANGVSVSTGYILYGPPGTGKTIMIRALAGTLGIPCFAVKIPELKSVYINESAQHINTLFQRARAAAKGSASGLALICLDEIDALMSPRTETSLYRSGDNNTSVTTFLSELDGLARDRSVIVIGTTNKDPKNPRELDEAIVRSGRLGTHIRIGLPDTKKREQVASMHIRKKPLYNGMISLPAFIASHSDGWSPADIAEVIQKVTRQLIVTQHSSSNPTQNQGSNNEAIKQSFELAIQEQNKEKKLAAHYS